MPCTLTQLIKDLAIDDVDRRYVERTLISKRDAPGDSPNYILAAVNRPVKIDRSVGEQRREDEYQLLPSALFSYVDYLEIKEARKQAAVAKKQSITAIKIAVWSSIRQRSCRHRPNYS